MVLMITIVTGSSLVGISSVSHRLLHFIECLRTVVCRVDILIRYQDTHILNLVFDTYV